MYTACGRIVCGGCSKTRANLTSLGFFGTQRVCDACKTQLPPGAVEASSSSLPSSPSSSSSIAVGNPIKERTIEMLKGDGTSVGEFPVELRPGRLDWQYPEGPASMSRHQPNRHCL
jgi:hypothetical protein